MWGLLDKGGWVLGSPWGHQAGLALPCWGRQLEGSKYSAGRPGHIPGRPARPAGLPAALGRTQQSGPRTATALFPNKQKNK